jgi:hypothetical protein
MLLIIQVLFFPLLKFNSKYQKLDTYLWTFISIFNYVKWLQTSRHPDIVYREPERDSVGIGKKNASYKTLFVYEIIRISILRLQKWTITHSNIFKHAMHTHIHINADIHA